MKPINVLTETGEFTKTSTPVTTFKKPAREANQYVCFGYGPLEICKHIRGKVSGSINADPINIIHASQKSTKEGLNKEFE